MKLVDKSNEQSRKWNADFSAFAGNLDPITRPAKKSNDETFPLNLTTSVDTPESPKKSEGRHEIRARPIPQKTQMDEESISTKENMETTHDQTQKLTIIHKKNLDGNHLSMSYTSLLATDFSRKLSILGSIENTKQKNDSASDGIHDSDLKSKNWMHGRAIVDVENMKSANSEEIKENEDNIHPPRHSSGLSFHLNVMNESINDDVTDKYAALNRVGTDVTDSLLTSCRDSAFFQAPQLVGNRSSTPPSYRSICDETKDDIEVESVQTLPHRIDRSKIAKVQEILKIFNRENPNDLFQCVQSECTPMTPEVQFIGSTGTCQMSKTSIEYDETADGSNRNLYLVHKQNDNRKADSTCCKDKGNDIISDSAISYNFVGKSKSTNDELSSGGAAPSEVFESLYRTPKKVVSPAFRKYAEVILGSSFHLGNDRHSEPYKIRHKVALSEDPRYGPTCNHDKMKPLADNMTSSKPTVGSKLKNIEKTRVSSHPFNMESLDRNQIVVAPVNLHHETTHDGQKIGLTDTEKKDKKLDLTILSSKERGYTSPTNNVKGLENILRRYQTALQTGQRHLIEASTLKKVDVLIRKQNVASVRCKRAKIFNFLKQARKDAQTQT